MLRLYETRVAADQEIGVPAKPKSTVRSDCATKPKTHRSHKTRRMGHPWRLPPKVGASGVNKNACPTTTERGGAGLADSPCERTDLKVGHYKTGKNLRPEA
jgi:hypothetical protein